MLENMLTTQRSLDTHKHIALSVFIIIYLLMNLLVYPVFLFIYLFGQRKKETNIFFEIMWSAKSLRYKIANII